MEKLLVLCELLLDIELYAAAMPKARKQNQSLGGGGGIRIGLISLYIPLMVLVVVERRLRRVRVDSRWMVWLPRLGWLDLWPSGGLTSGREDFWRVMNLRLVSMRVGVSWRLARLVSLEAFWSFSDCCE